MIEVFPISASFFEWAGWLQTIGRHLLVLLFIVSIGIHALRGFEHIQFEKKILNFVICGVLILWWPDILRSLKVLVDEFNGLLVTDVFHMSWDQSLQLPILDQFKKMFGSIDLSNALLLPFNAGILLIINASIKILHLSFSVFFFLYAAFGPLVIARAVLSDEIGVFLELIREVAILLLWQSFLLMIIGFVDGSIGSDPGFVMNAESSIGRLGWALALCVIVLFVPIITRKVVLNIGLGVVAPIVRVGATMAGLGAMNFGLGLLAGPAKGLGAFGAPFAAAAHSFGHAKHLASEAIGFAEEMRLHNAHHRAEHELHGAHHALHEAHHGDHHDDHDEHDEHHDEHHESHHEEHHHESHHDHGDHHGHDSHHGGHGGHHGGHAEHHGHDSHHADHGHGSGHHSNSLAEEPWVIASGTHDGPAMKSFLKSIFKRSGKVSEAAERVRALRQQILLIRGPKDSDKYHDIATLGIHHEDYFDESVKVLQKYREGIDKFNSKFGWLYDYNGTFAGKESMRPKSWDQIETTSEEEGPEA
jgi:hypothetical protein